MPEPPAKKDDRNKQGKGRNSYYQDQPVIKPYFVINPSHELKVQLQMNTRKAITYNSLRNFDSSLLFDCRPPPILVSLSIKSTVMKFCSLLVISLITLQLQAQNALPGPQVSTAAPNKHFHPGLVLLPDSTILTGYIRDYIRANASIVYLDPHSGRKRTLTGAQIISVDIDTTRFLCLRGDFFRVVAVSKLLFLQKSSDASGKPAYNGSQPILINGTEGRVNDYFLYDPSEHKLQLVNNKTMNNVIPTAFFKQK